MMFSHLTAIDVNACMHHRSVKLQPDAFLFPFHRNFYIFCIITGISRKIPGIHTCHCFFGNRKADHSIMRQIHCFSRICFQHPNRIQHSSSERPFLIKLYLLHICSPFHSYTLYIFNIKYHTL